MRASSTNLAANVRHSRKADASCWRFPASCTSPGNKKSNPSNHLGLKSGQSSSAAPPLVQEWFQKTEGPPEPWLAKAVWHNWPRCNPCSNRDCCKQLPPGVGVAWSDDPNRSPMVPPGWMWQRLRATTWTTVRHLNRRGTKPSATGFCALPVCHQRLASGRLAYPARVPKSRFAAAVAK